MPIDIPFPRVSAPGERPQLSGGRIVNGVLEQASGGAVVIKRAPGLTRIASSAAGAVHCRGMIAANASTLLVVYDDTVEAVTRTGADTTASVSLGSLPGSDLVTLARNNAAIPQIVCVSSSGVYVLTAGGSPAPYPDGDVGSPNSVCYIDGYFVFTYGSGKFAVSGLNTTDINSLDFATAEANPDPLIRGVAFGSKLLLFGQSTIEIWINAGSPPPGVPFSRTAVVQRGLAAPHAVAGFEDGFVGALVWVGPDNLVYKLVGAEALRISTHDIERDLQALTEKSTLRAFAYMCEGHPYIAIKCQLWTWVYDLLTATWQERRSHDRLSWRAECSYLQWGEWRLGDESTSAIYRPNGLAYDEDGAPLVWEVTSGAVKDFPARFGAPRADFDFVAGTGDPASVAEPRVSIAWSDDGGATYSTPLLRGLGRQGAYGNRVAINRVGRVGPHGKRFRLTVSDAVFVGLLGGKLQAIQGASF